MKMWSLMMCVLLLAAVCVMAQPEPPAGGDAGNQGRGGRNNNNNAQQWMNNLGNGLVNQQVTMKVLPQGLFVLRGGVLAKFDATNLQEQGVLELFGPAPAPIDMRNATPEERQRAMQDRTKRMQQAEVLPMGADLLVVIGEQFFRIKLADLTIKVQSELVVPDAPQPPAQGRQFGGFAMPTTLELKDNTLYVLRGADLLTVDVETGKVVATGKLPVQMVPPQPQGNPGGMRDQNNQNNRNGRNQPAAGAQRGAAAAPRGEFDEGARMVVVGTLEHQELEGGFWTLKTELGVFVLEGAKLNELVKTPDATKKRVRVNGTYANHPGIAQFGKGYLTVEKFELLP